MSQSLRRNRYRRLQKRSGFKEPLRLSRDCDLRES
uniref:Uncharacterized protein n=1 Tax=Anguilla anguilla TaxID=7936 RepID=A0A0E9RQK7_ANGAN